MTFCSLSLVALLPVSINGYGMQEGCYVLMLTSLGFALDEALVVALAIRLLQLAPAVVGGVLFAWSDLRGRTSSTSSPRARRRSQREIGPVATDRVPAQGRAPRAGSPVGDPCAGARPSRRLGMARRAA